MLRYCDTIILMLFSNYCCILPCQVRTTLCCNLPYVPRSAFHHFLNPPHPPSLSLSACVFFILFLSENSARTTHIRTCSKLADRSSDIISTITTSDLRLHTHLHSFVHLESRRRPRAHLPVDVVAAVSYPQPQKESLQVRRSPSGAPCELCTYSNNSS